MAFFQVHSAVYMGAFLLLLQAPNFYKTMKNWFKNVSKV